MNDIFLPMNRAGSIRIMAHTRARIRRATNRFVRAETLSFVHVANRLVQYENKMVKLSMVG